MDDEYNNELQQPADCDVILDPITGGDWAHGGTGTTG